MQSWFPEAKLGIFIHWGIYAVNGTLESWEFFNGHSTYEEYFAQASGFTASKYDAEDWAALFKASGAQYAVLTTKHHDGVALWDTQAGSISTVKSTPAGRDLITPYVEALRHHGLRVGFYFSHLDWSHPDYASIGSDDPAANRFAYRQGPTDEEGWERFLSFHRAQLQELCTQFGPVDLLWFDGDWERDAETWRMKELRDQLHAWQPNAVINSRMQGYGDYATPEQGMPVVPPEGPWEFCVTHNDNWGWRFSDTNWKSPQYVLRMFLETIGMGGNLLFDIGPMEDGSIPPESREALLFLGDWISRHAEAVYGSRAGVPTNCFYGPSTRSQDGKSLYLFVFGDPRGHFGLRGIKGDIVSATLLDGTPLTWKRFGHSDWNPVPGAYEFALPAGKLDPEVTVVKIVFREPFSVYQGPGRD